MFFIVSAVWAQSPNAPTVLINEMTQTPIDYTTKKVVIFIHGWNPDGSPDSYAASPEWSNLETQMKASLSGSDWGLILYHWEKDANTGLISWGEPQTSQHAADAAYNAFQNGTSIASLLLSAAPELREVHFIAHSAGTWAAYNAALTLLQNNPYVVVEITCSTHLFPNLFLRYFTPHKVL